VRLVTIKNYTFCSNGITKLGIGKTRGGEMKVGEMMEMKTCASMTQMD